MRGTLSSNGIRPSTLETFKQKKGFIMPTPKAQR